ncbi:MAG TPA: SRPBCC family protein [Ilumatobacteraceae bacterium]
MGTTIERSPRDVYEYVSDPRHLSEWAAGLARRPVERIDGQWVVDSPLGRIVVEFAPANDDGIADHVVTLPNGTSVHNPMRVIPNADGCDVVFSVRRQRNMTDSEFADDVAAVRKDLDALRSILQR